MKSGRVNKKYRYIEHLSDIGLEFYGNTIEELFENAGEGMFSIICNLKKIRSLERRNVRIRSEHTDFEDLLILWLEKLLYWHEVDNILFAGFKVAGVYEKNGGVELSAEVSGEKIDPERHVIRTVVKAPTYHMLDIKKDGRRYSWKGRIIFDV
jgi:SHS2 domain-containing protein